MAALETRQGRHEPPQAYYSQLRQAYFGTRNEPDMEYELNFKTLFQRNEPSSRHKPPSWRSRMSTNKEHSAVARVGAESLRQTKYDLRKECKNPSSS